MREVESDQGDRGSGDGGYQRLLGTFEEYPSSEMVPMTFTLAVVEHDTFQSIMGLVIMLNIFVLCGETDHPELIVWHVFDNIFVLVFIIELVLRIMHHSCSGYYCGKDKYWAFLDTSIVLLGVFDLWLAPYWINLDVQRRGHRATWLKLPRILRMLRMSRLLRVLRVFKMSQKLIGFKNALHAMLGTFVWIFAVIFVVISACGIILTHVFGHAEDGDVTHLHDEDALGTARGLFSDVPTSLFTLFRLMTIDNWDDVASPLIELHPGWRIFFVCFIAFTSWSMLSVLTAVASEHMIKATSNRKEVELKDQSMRSQQFVYFLRDAFVDADVDGNGLLDKDEFKALIEQDFVHERMEQLGVHLTSEELYKAWDMLDIDESGELTIDEFVSGLSYLQEGLSTKHIVNVDYALKRMNVRCQQRIVKIRAAMVDIKRQNCEIMDKLQKQDDAYQEQKLALWMFRDWASGAGRGATFREFLRVNDSISEVHNTTVGDAPSDA